MNEDYDEDDYDPYDRICSYPCHVCGEEDEDEEEDD